MPRIRSVHPDICDDETMSMVSANAERTFIRLWTHLDDDGRGVDNPKLWKGKLYPLHDDVTASHVDADLNELASHGLIIRYEVDGKRYLCAKPSTWKKFQKPQRPTKSKLPPPTADLAYTSTVLADMSASDPRALRYGGEWRGEEMDVGVEGGSGGEVPHPAPTTTPVENALTEKAAEIARRASLRALDGGKSAETTGRVQAGAVRTSGVRA